MRTAMLSTSVALTLGALVIAAAAQAQGPARSSAVPPPNSVVLIPAPAYALDSRVATSQESVLRAGSDARSPGMNVFRPTPGEVFPPVMSAERMRRLAWLGPYDSDAASAYFVPEFWSPPDPKPMRADYEQRAARVRQLAVEAQRVAMPYGAGAFAPGPGPAALGYGGPEPMWFGAPSPVPPASWYAPDPYWYGIRPACSTSVGLGFWGRGHLAPSFGISCW